MFKQIERRLTESPLALGNHFRSPEELNSGHEAEGACAARQGKRSEEVREMSRKGEESRSARVMEAMMRTLRVQGSLCRV